MSASMAFQGANLLNADFGIGAKGALNIAGLAHGPLKIKNVQLTGRYDGETDRVLIDDGELDSDGLTAHMTGKSDLVRDGSKVLSQIKFETSLDKVALNMPGVLKAPLSLRSIAIRGSYLTATRELAIERAELSGGNLSIQASARVGIAPRQSAAIDAQGQISNIGVRDLLNYWPVPAAAGVRSWLDRNVPAGTVGPVKFNIHLPKGMLDQPTLPDDALNVSIPINGAEANYIQGLRHLTQLKGVATLTGKTFAADISSAHIGPLAVSQGHVAVPDLQASTSIGDFSARGEWFDAGYSDPRRYEAAKLSDALRDRHCADERRRQSRFGISPPASKEPESR